MIKSILRKITGTQLLFIIVLFIVSIAVFLLFVYSDTKIAIITSISILLVLIITRSIWGNQDLSNNKVELTSYTLALLTITSFGIWDEFFSNVLIQILDKYLGIKVKIENDNWLPYAEMAFVVFIVLIVNHYKRDSSGMGKHPNPIDNDIPERDFKNRLKGVCSALQDNIRSIDIKTDWSNQHFVSLDAEVEVVHSTRKRKVITDLLKSIKNSNDRVFLVLGEPGSGKSVALRKLCRDLLAEVEKTGKIPIYINLKEWRSDVRWVEGNLPTALELNDFICTNLSSIDIFASKFFADYFDKLHESGRLYFILDSFDEIPALLDEEENSLLINHLSEVIFYYLKGARSEKSQGILASRIFRKPTNLFQTETILEIRPLSESKIVDFFKKRIKNYNQVVLSVFKDRQDLVVVLRNPFLASLFIDFLDKNSDALPESQFVMYNSYIIRTIESSQAKLKEYNVNVGQVVEYAIKIAQEMFRSNSLELSIQNLSFLNADVLYNHVAEVLKFGRIGRSNSNNTLFSFTHRRFAEFFFVQGLSLSEELIDLQAIPNDSQTRDALVLYCQIASFENAKTIALYCWDIISKSGNIKDKSVLHSLRFLNDAFISRKECISDFQEELSLLIEKHIAQGVDMITVKISLESVGLLNEGNIDKIVSKAFLIGNSWTDETAIKSCRHLSKISTKLESDLQDYVGSIQYKDLFFEQFRDLHFSLSLTDAFFRVRRTLYLRIFDVIPNILFVSLIVWIMNAFPKKGNDSPDSLVWKVIMYGFMYLGSMYYLNLPFFVSIYSKKSAKMMKHLLILFGSFPLIILVFFLYYFIKTSYVIPQLLINISSFLMDFLFIVLVIIFISAAFHATYERIVDIILIAKISITKKMNRDIIYQQYISFKTNFFKDKYVNRLSTEVDEVTGEWPNDSFLSITKNPQIIRLAKLEEKWLKLD